LKYRNLSAGILENTYKRQALVPESSWLGTEAPEAPKVIAVKKGEDVMISWEHSSEEIFQWVVHY